MIEIREMDSSYIFDTCPLGEPLEPLRLAKDEYQGCAKRAREIRRRFFSEVRDKYGNCVLFAWDDGKIVGFLIFLPKPVAKKMGLKPMPDSDRQRASKTLVYACMQVVPEYQGKGLGTKLVRFLVDWAKSNGWSRIEVNRVARGTDDEDWRWSWALPKWERRGFRIAKEHPFISIVLDMPNTEDIEGNDHPSGD
jgi:GNAT superfamily N-acetyltransferase